MSIVRERKPAVFAVTAHGRQELEYQVGETLLEILRKNWIPWSSVSVYYKDELQGAEVITPALDTPLVSSKSGAYMIYFNRNVNLFKFGLADYSVAPAEGDEIAATEYFYQNFDNEKSEVTTVLKKLSPDLCRQLVAERVGEVLAAIPKGSKIVVGVSGGGDSNALLYGMSIAAKQYDLDIHPVIIKGIPEWDEGVPRAQELSKKYGLPLHIVEDSNVREIFGVPSSGASLMERFEKEFQGDDFEYFATLIIRVVLSSLARKIGANNICTGANLEDVTSDALFRVINGWTPAPLPVRQIGDQTLVMPLWLCPKKIIDGCFPKYSLENYEMRYPCMSLGRSLYYGLTFNLQSNFPGIVERFIQGAASLAASDPTRYHRHEQLGFEVERQIPLPLLAKFERMLGRRPIV